MEHFELFAASHCEVGECVLWHDTDNMLYWIDVVKGIVYRKHLTAVVDDFESFEIGLGKIGGIVFTRDGAFLLFAENGKVWHWSPESVAVLIAELTMTAGTRFNDVIADPEGRVYCGLAPLQPDNNGSLWRLDINGSFVCLEPTTAGMPNGMGFSPDLHYFYFTVTHERVIYRYDYNRQTGAITNRIKLIKVPVEDGFPDGMTVDSDGYIWSAQWNGSKLVRYSAAGDKIQEYKFDIRKISCVTFGGKDYSDVFVSTANYPWDDRDWDDNHAGAVFRLKSKSKGLPEFKHQ